MGTRSHFEKWRNIIGFSLVVALNPVVPLWILGPLAIDIVDELILGNPCCAIHEESCVYQEISLLNSSLQMYKTLNGSFPTVEEGLKALVEAPAGSRRAIKLMTMDQLFDPWGFPYQYKQAKTSLVKPFKVWSIGPDGIDGTTDDIER